MPEQAAVATIAREQVVHFSERVRAIRKSLHQVVVGQDATIDLLLCCALTGSHALLVGVPGLAKTLMVKALASAFHWKFSRIQFTPDLMPSDITGYELLSRESNGNAPTMTFRRGPVFANLVLADEINRAAPKTQSAMLEAMAERHVTVGGSTYDLEEPFVVVATQNPIEQEGTYPLPEAQLDRFMMEIQIDYPTPAQEEEIVMKTSGGTPPLPKAEFDRETFLQLRDLVLAVPVPQNVAAFAVKLCGSSRPNTAQTSKYAADYVAWGAGPRGAQNLVQAAKARALLDGRTVPTVGDIQSLAIPILRHRIIVNHRAVGDGVTTETVIRKLLDGGGPVSTEVVTRFLDMQALAALEHMRFSTKHRIEGTYSGRHKSRQKGGAGEFVDYREYSSGEDLRHIDWKVLARSGKAYIRLFQEETNLVCTLAVDASRSMEFGAGHNGTERGSKLEYAQYLSTALSHVISRGQDRVGLAVMTDRLVETIEPGSTRGHVARIHEAIERISTSPTTIMAPAMRTLFERSKLRGVLMLMSDFLFDDLDEVFAAVRLFRHRMWEVVVLHLVHPGEEQLPEGAAYRFEGLENDGRIDCSPNEIRDLYRARFEAHVGMVRTLALATGCDYRRTSTGISYLKVLGDFLIDREG